MSDELTAEELAWFTIDPKEAITDLLAGIATLTAERDEAIMAFNLGHKVECVKLSAQVDALRTALENACPEEGWWQFNSEATSRDGELDCSWCMGPPDGHEKDCAWVAAREALGGLS